MNVRQTVIRPAQRTDVGAIALLSGELGYPTSPEAMARRLDVLLDDPKQCVFVATQGNTIAGWIHGMIASRLESDAFVEIGGLVVGETFRSNGTGRGLVRAVSNWTLDQNIHMLRVRSNVHRDATHHFYQHLGFRITKVQIVFDMDLSQTR